MTGFFHAYDLRGKYPEQISEKEAKNVGKAYGTFTDAEKVLVGRDGRKHAKKITESFIEGITSTGTDVVDAGVAPSPVVYFGMVENNIKSAAVVTASHNPSEYTGFKFCKENALAMSRAGGMKDIEEIYTEENFETGEGKTENIDLKQSYIEFVKDNINLQKDLDIVINFGNGVATVLGEELFEELGCNVKTVNEELDGNFPNHLPAPGNQEAQKQLEAEMAEEDLGIIFDGDGDRAGFILPGYGYISEDEVLAVFSKECLESSEGTVIYDLRASKLVPEIIEKYGGKPSTARVGHTFISEEIHSDPSIVFAGELSGHYYFPGFNVPWDDGLFAAALMCQIVSEQDLAELLNSFEDYPVSPELRLECPHSAKQTVIDRLKQEYSDHKLSTVDGVKIHFDKGWALIRPSNTEEKMSVRCEADTQEDVDRLLKQVREDVERLIETS